MKREKKLDLNLDLDLTSLSLSLFSLFSSRKKLQKLPYHNTSSSALINLMVMDYGAPNKYVCVVDSISGLCDMGKSAVAAAESLKSAYGIPYSRIELTPMIGGNDATDEHFTIANAQSMSSYVLSKGLAGVHYWSFDRDRDCARGYASSTCNSLGVPSAGTLGFFKAFLGALGLA